MCFCALNLLKQGLFTAEIAENAEIFNDSVNQNSLLRFLHFLLRVLLRSLRSKVFSGDSDSRHRNKNKLLFGPQAGFSGIAFADFWQEILVEEAVVQRLRAGNGCTKRNKANDQELSHSRILT